MGISEVFNFHNGEEQNTPKDKLDWLIMKVMRWRLYNFDLSIHEETSNFFNMMTASNLLLVISIPTKINNIKDTLTDSIYTNRYNPDLVSSNITGISGYLPSFLIIPKNNAVKIPKIHSKYG